MAKKKALPEEDLYADIPKEFRPVSLKSLRSRLQNDEDSEIVKEGTLKEALYDCSFDLPTPEADDLYTESERQKILKDIAESFTVAIPQVARFVGRKQDGYITWEEARVDGGNYGLHELSESWAEEHLNITTLADKKYCIRERQSGLYFCKSILQTYPHAYSAKVVERIARQRNGDTIPYEIETGWHVIVGAVLEVYELTPANDGTYKHSMIQGDHIIDTYTVV